MAFFMAAHGARVTGIDISPVAVEQGRSRAAAEQVSDQVTFEVMDAESLQFPDGTFDLVCGSGVLHHLDLTREIRRTWHGCCSRMARSSSSNRSGTTP